MDNWFTITPHQIVMTFGERSIALQDILHIDYRYIDDRLKGATIAIQRHGRRFALRVSAQEAQVLKGLIEDFVLVAPR